VVDLVRDGVVLPYDDAGTGFPPVVFVHGAACNRRFWCQQVPRFCATHRVVAVDLRGHGESDAPCSGTRCDCSPRTWRRCLRSCASRARW
jgi:pimeloyl-ACP methyl ester carboxylesterase